ncbi:MAG: AsmA-like C-terminal region-containing protein [Pseudomonadota bacterium]
MLAVVVALGVVRFAPESALRLVNNNTAVSIQAPGLRVDLFPLAIQTPKLSAQTSELAIEATEVSIEVDLWAAMNEQPFWSAFGQSIELTTLEDPQSKVVQSESSAGQLEIPPLALQFLKVEVAQLSFADATYHVVLGREERIQIEFTADTPQFQVNFSGSTGVAGPNPLTLSQPDFQGAFDELPFVISGGMVVLDGQNIKVNDTVIGVDGHSFQTNLDVSLQPLMVAGELSSSAINFKLAESDPIEPVAGEVVDESQTPVLFSDEPLNLDLLTTMTIDLKVQIDRLALGSVQLEQFRTRVNLARGALQMPLTAQIGAGTLAHQLEMEVNDGVTIHTTMDYQDVVLESLGIKQIQGGSLLAQASLRSQGASPRDLAGGLVGTAVVVLEDAQIADQYIDSFGSDLILELIQKLNPFHADSETTNIKCALIDVPIADGVMALNDGVWLQTPKMNIAASGKVDFGMERLNVVLTPSARQGLGVNVGSLVKFIKLGGHLTAPAPQLDTVGALQSGLAIGAAVSTGGVSLVAEGLTKRAMNAGSRCAQWRSEQSKNLDAELVETGESID